MQTLTILLANCRFGSCLKESHWKQITFQVVSLWLLPTTRQPIRPSIGGLVYKENDQSRNWMIFMHTMKYSKRSYLQSIYCGFQPEIEANAKSGKSISKPYWTLYVVLHFESRNWILIWRHFLKIQKSWFQKLKTLLSFGNIDFPKYLTRWSTWLF